MKKFLLFVLLAGCASAPQKPTSMYECSIVGMHGVFAKMLGQYPSIEMAEEEANYVRIQLVAKKIVPNNTGVMCNKVEGK